MASLKKPSSCSNCARGDSLRLWVIDWTAPNYEGWVCCHCFPHQTRDGLKIYPMPDSFVVSRPKRNKDICRKCGARRGEKEFVDGKNLCIDCKSAIHADYRKEKAPEMKQYRDKFWAKQPKGRRGQIVRDSIQRSPESFLRHLATHIRKSSKRRKVAQKKLNPACLIVRIDYDFLLQLYHEQKGFCPFLKVPMTHEFNNLLTMSVDRIDSDKGYIPGNVQLVTQFIQGAKRHFSNDVVHIILNRYFEERLRRRLAGIENLQEACRKEALVESAVVDKEIVASLAKAPEIVPIRKLIEDDVREKQYEEYKSRSQI